jgi:integron integrase
MNAIVFVYRDVLGGELGPDHLGAIVAERASRPRKVPTVLSVSEVRRLIDAMRPGSMHRTMTELLYGCGLRLMECCTLRVRDLDFERAQIIVRQGKGDKDRLVMLPRSLEAALRRRVRRTAERHERDVASGGGYAPVCDAVAHKMPSAAREFAWQFVFPSRVLRFDGTGLGRRWYTDKAALDRAIRAAARQAGLVKRVSAHALRHSFATHLLEAGYDIRQAQTLLGHASVTTTMIYTHVMNKPAVAVTSPLDRLAAPAMA